MTRIPSHRLSPATSATSTDTGDDWRHRAACLGEDPELFFPIGNTGTSLIQIEEAKAVCRRCPVMDTCLHWALDTRQDAGIWGGLSEDELRAAKRRDTRARRNTRTQPAGPAPARKPLPTASKYPAKHRPDCGTLTGYRRHQSAEEDACDPCRAAKAADSAERRRQQRITAA